MTLRKFGAVILSTTVRSLETNKLIKKINAELFMVSFYMMTRVFPSFIPWRRIFLNLLVANILIVFWCFQGV